MPENTDSNRPGDAWAEATDDVAATAGESKVEEDEVEEGKAEDEVTAEDETASEKASEAKQPEEKPATAKDVLAGVAAGTISPDEAAELLDKLKGDKPDQDEGARVEVPPAATKPKRVRIRAVGRRVKIVGEPFVKTIAVDGPHVVRQEGDTLLISSEGEFGASLDGFTLTPPRSLRDVQQKLMDLGRELSIRVNPALEIEAEITAGSINAERAPLLAQVRVTAGSARVRDVEGPIDVLVQAGSAQVEGKIVNGRSRLRVESGSLQLRLLQGSSVRIRPDAQLGRVQWDPPARPGKETDEQVVGLGDARLDLEVVMGAATVKEAP